MSTLKTPEIARASDLERDLRERLLRKKSGKAGNSVAARASDEAAVEISHDRSLPVTTLFRLGPSQFGNGRAGLKGTSYPSSTSISGQHACACASRARTKARQAG